MKTDILLYIRTVKIIEHARAGLDARRRVDRHIVEYRDNQGNEYRKVFETRQKEQPIIPATGTHAEINAMLQQY